MKKIIGFIMLLMLPFLWGCTTNELEKHAFPLALGAEWQGEETGFQIYMAYPDLQGQDAQQNPVAMDAVWSGQAQDFFSGADAMSESSSKNVDFNHLKVIILDQQIFASEQAREALISFFMEQKNAAWNTYVMLTDGDMGQLFSGELSIGNSLGIYLEEIIEDWSNIRREARVTVGDFMGQYYDQKESALVPVLSVQEGTPEISGYAAVRQLHLVSALDTAQAYEIMLLRGQLRAFSFAREDGTRAALSQIRVTREITASTAGENPVMTIQMQALLEIQNRLSLTPKQQKTLQKQVQQELERRLLQLLQTEKETSSFDVTDSFLLLPGYHRGLWQQYGGARKSYEEKLEYRVQTTLTVQNTG